ncbi:helix-turn-helix domain-containing protein [Terrabacter aeriphilus]|uniref:Helix-turn-helix domain-containing protein n=2 Tax=Terrabacter aeriphilus TaxID=515662 RepID=A0ABP9JJN5_9MICO
MEDLMRDAVVEAVADAEGVGGTRRAVLDLVLAESGDPRTDGSGLTAAQVGRLLGIHVTTARWHLERLVAAGQLVAGERRGGVGRPRKVYRTAGAHAPGLGGADALDSFAALLISTWAQAREGGERVAPEEAGARWVADRTSADASTRAPAGTTGAWLGKVGLTVDILAEWGYEPELQTADRGRSVELTLHDCPFAAMARDHPEVVCGIHLGLLRGTLAAVGEPDAGVELQPFVTASSCTARMTRAH